MKQKIQTFSDLHLHPDYRWDGEYLCFESFQNSNLKYLPIGDILLSSQYGVSIAMNENRVGTKIYRMNEIRNMFCDREISKYAELNTNKIAEYKLKDKDVLFNRTNSQDFVGRTAIFREFSDDNIVFASYLVRLNPDSQVVRPEYLTVFLNTKYGVLDVKRRARISINQSNINPEELKRVELPLLCDSLQADIASSFDKAFELIQASESEYRTAHDILLSELNLTYWQPRHRLTFVKRYSDTERERRIDAEHFQPKYDDILRTIAQYPGGCSTLHDLVKVEDDNFEPENTLEYKYIELANIGDNGEVADCMIKNGSDLPTRARRKVATGDIIVSSLEGSLNRIALIDHEYNQALCSTGFYVFNSKFFNSETLLVLMKSLVGQMQLKKGSSGTILSAIKKDNLNKLLLPIIVTEKQETIKQKIIESFRLRKQCKYLLECAKRAVEIAIEKDESTAIDWLNGKTK